MEVSPARRQLSKTFKTENLHAASVVLLTLHSEWDLLESELGDRFEVVGG